MVLEARRLGAEGLTFTDICKRLDVIETSFRLWSHQYDEQRARVSSSMLRSVALVQEPSEPTAAPSATRPEISMATPDGFRFEGLELDDALVLLEAAR